MTDETSEITHNALSPQRDPETGQFLKGYRGGPGRGKGSRNKLGEAFLCALNEDFNEHGVEAIEEVRKTKPDQYLKVIASILPKELKVDVGITDEMTDDDLLERIKQLDDVVRPFLEGKAVAAALPSTIN